MSEKRLVPAPRLAFALVSALVVGLLAALFPSRAVGQTDEGEPLTLQNAVARALARAPRVAVAQADVDLASATERLSRAHSGPEAFVGTNPGYASGLPVMIAGQVPSVFNASVRQPIYDVSLKADASNAKAEAYERDVALERARSETVRAVVLAYGRVAADGDLLTGARHELEAQETMARRVAALAAEGRVTAVEADAAGVEVARARQKVLDRGLARELDELDLRRLLDWPAATPLALAGDPLAGIPAPPPSGNLEAARAGDVETRSLEREVELLRSVAERRARTFQPTVVAEMQYLRLPKYNHYEDYFVHFRENDFAIGISVSVPVWLGGRTAERTAEARARVARAEAALKGRARDLEIAVRRAEADLARAQAGEGVARSAEAVSRERARIASALVAEGRGEPDAAPLADVALWKAREELANATAAVLAARVSLLDLRGELVGKLGEAAVTSR